MPDFRLHITMKDVAEGDATDLAQRIWDENAESFDAARGEFDVTVLHVDPSGAQFQLDWEPMEAA